MVNSKIYFFIPARLDSTRFPKKILYPIKGRSLIEWVYINLKSSLRKLSFVDKSKIIILVDDQTVLNKVKSFIVDDDECFLTPKDVKNGTWRILWALSNIQSCKNVQNLVNIQADEPLINEEIVQNLISLSQNLDSKSIGTLVYKSFDVEAFLDTNVVKVVLAKADHEGLFNALYFSRAPIPYSKNPEKLFKSDTFNFYHHIGVYAYTRESIFALQSFKESFLEKTESLEQLAFLENGFTVRVKIVKTALVGVDIPEDVSKVEELLDA